MATTSPISSALQTETAKVPLWLWPNLLSLDAPLIAMLWQDVFARDADVKLTLASRAALPLTVWLIYLVDRLLDTSQGMPGKFTARHAFYVAQRGVCQWLTGFAAMLACVSVVFLRLPVMTNGFIVSGAVAIYLWAVHETGGRLRKSLPKEAFVGLIFALGTGLAPFTWASDGARLVFPALLFGMLCWVNSSAIEIWEGGTVDRMSTWAVRNMKLVAIATCVVCILLALGPNLRHSAAALTVAGIGFWALAEMHAELGADMLRVGIDVPLLAPLLLIGLR